jgi:hypothetical protein
LKNHRDCHEQCGDGVADQPIESGEAENRTGKNGNKDNEDRSAQKLHGARALNEIKQPVKNECHKDNVDYTRKRKMGKEFRERIQHAALLA